MTAERYFVIVDATILNVIVYDPHSAFHVADGAVLLRAATLPHDADIGWHEVGGTWLPPAALPITVPTSVTPRQLRLALFGAGKLAQVEAFVTGGQAPPEAVISWEYATEFLRSDPMLGQFAAMLGLSDEEVDRLFIAAAQIQ